MARNHLYLGKVVQYFYFQEMAWANEGATSSEKQD